jgi:hypothetical protein
MLTMPMPPAPKLPDPLNATVNPVPGGRNLPFHFPERQKQVRDARRPPRNCTLVPTPIRGILLPREAFMQRLLFIAMGMAILTAQWARADSGDNNTLGSADGQYQLIVPKPWESNDFHLPNVQIGAIEKHRGEYAEVIVERQEDYTDSLQQYADAKRATMAMSLDNPRLTPGERLKINGQIALRFQIHGQLPNSSVSIAYSLTVIKTKTHYVQVIGWTEESHFASNRAELEGLANGFSETSNEGK